MEDSVPEKDWGNVRFRPTARASVAKAQDDAWTRFVMGAVLFVSVAALYPWYSYTVQAHLMARDLHAATKEWEKESAKVEREVMQQWGAAQSPMQVQPEPVAAPVRNVRVMGVSQNSSGPVVIVQLDGADPGEYSRLICHQAGLMLRAPVQGRYLRIQRYRGNAPAQDAGRMRC